jgi:4-amino-4-deoxy-L-arabinose transferase-like glycosyltransferase
MTNDTNVDWIKAASAILAGAFLLRLGWALLVPVIPLSDSNAYDILALTLAGHGVYGFVPDQPSAYWPVGTSAIYAALYFLFGHSYTPIVALNIALSTGIVGLTMWLGRTFFDDTIGIIAGGFMAIWPSQIAFVTVLASELPFTFFVLLGLAAWFNLWLSSSVRAVAGGLAFGVSTYIRPIALLLPIVLWLSAFPNWRKLRERLPMMFLALIAIGVAIAPWSIRNTKLYDHFTLISTNGGTNLWMGNNPDTQGFYMPLPASVEGLNEYQRDKALGEEAKRYIMAEPVSFVLRTIKKAALLHIGETIAIHWNEEGIKYRLGERALFPLKLLTQGFWIAALLLALAGLIVMVRERGIIFAFIHPVILTWFYFTAIYAVTVIQDRYHFPLHPLISMLASVTTLAAVRRVQLTSR